MLYNAIITDPTTFHDELIVMRDRLNAMAAEYQAQYDAFDARISAFLASDARWTDEDEDRYEERKEQRRTLENALYEINNTLDALGWAISDVDSVDTLVDDLPDEEDDLPHDDEEEEEPEWMARESYLYEKHKQDRLERDFNL